MSYRLESSIRLNEGVSASQVLAAIAKIAPDCIVSADRISFTAENTKDFLFARATLLKLATLVDATSN